MFLDTLSHVNHTEYLSFFTDLIKVDKRARAPPRASDGRHFVFNVTRGPRHGQVDVLASNKMDVMRSNTSFFTSAEIAEERLLYRHDDSESRRDAFHFVATSDSYSVRRPASSASSASDFQG